MYSALHEAISETSDSLYILNNVPRVKKTVIDDKNDNESRLGRITKKLGIKD